MGDGAQTNRVTSIPEKLDQWHDFRKSVGLVSVVLFLFCLLALGNVGYQLAIVGDEHGIFDPLSFLGFLLVGAPLGVAAVSGVRVYRAANNAESKRLGRIMGFALLAAAVLLVVTGIVRDGLS
ncbi:hypothetical protein AB0B85_20125 [Micromonospora sp. NPDC049044]|uniref:hypothetical protein n=1 Tax=Micromonospora sp. NPDC049044 TaxID=3154827 RepID=UPI0033C5D043